MSQHDAFIERLESYLDDFEGSTPMPDSIRWAVRASLPVNKQERGPLVGARRFLAMSLHLPAPAQYGLAAAALVAAVVIGASIFAGGGGVGDPDEPSAQPSASASAAADPNAPQDVFGVPSTLDIPAGRWFLDAPAYPARIEFEVPEGWWHYWAASDRPSSDVHAVLVNSEDTGAVNGSGWGVAFAIVDEVRVDPCDAEAGTWDPSVSASANAMAEAFQTYPDLPATVEDVTIGGYDGKRVELETDAVPCEAALFTTPAGYVFGVSQSREDPPQQPEQFTFLDVEGTVLVLWTTDYPGTNYFEIDGGAEYDPEGHVADQAQLRDILDSIVLVPRP